MKTHTLDQLRFTQITKKLRWLNGSYPRAGFCLVLTCIATITVAQPLDQQPKFPDEHKQIIGEAQSLTPDTPEVKTLWVIGPLVDVFLGPGAGYPIIHTLERGETVVVSRQFTQWVKIQSRHAVDGWIKLSDLQHLADKNRRPLTAKPVPVTQAGAFSVQFAVGTIDGSTSGLGGIGYGLSEHLRADLLLSHATDGELQGRGITGQLTLDLTTLGHWQTYLNLGFGGYNIDGTFDGQNNFDTFKAGFGVRRHIISGLEGSFEYAKELILISGPSNIHADALRFGVLTYF